MKIMAHGMIFFPFWGAAGGKQSSCSFFLSSSDICNKVFHSFWEKVNWYLQFRILFSAISKWMEVLSFGRCLLTKEALLQKDTRKSLNSDQNVKLCIKINAGFFLGLNVKIGCVWFFSVRKIHEFSGRCIHGEGPFCIRKLLVSSSKKCSLGSDLRTRGHI